MVAAMGKREKCRGTHDELHGPDGRGNGLQPPQTACCGERQVEELIAKGLQNKQIAGRLHISLHTVKSHVRSILDKLALGSRVQVAVHASGDRATPGPAADKKR